MPVTGITGGEGPFNGFKSYTCLYIWVLINVGGVVVINKIICADLVKDRRGNQHQRKANPKVAVFG
jgi:hypothetical protein